VEPFLIHRRVRSLLAQPEACRLNVVWQAIGLLYHSMQTHNTSQAGLAVWKFLKTLRDGESSGGIRDLQVKIRSIVVKRNHTIER
jgi:hypothetical protein